MKDAVGSSLLLYLVIIILGVVGTIIMGTNAHSKAYKAKNSIVSTIDQHYEVENTDCFSDTSCIDEINNDLKDRGYSLKSENASICTSNNIKNHYKNSDDKDGEAVLIYPNAGDSFNGYCIYKVTVNTSSDYYYSIITFSHLNIPPFGTLFKTAVYGETRVYYDTSLEIEG